MPVFSDSEVDMAKMDPEKREISRAVGSRQEKYWKISDAIWSYAELGLEKYKSSKLLADTLERAGFKVDRGLPECPPLSLQAGAMELESRSLDFWESTMHCRGFLKRQALP
jgi:hypothetical protein